MSEARATPLSGTADQDLAFASQWYLMWLRFRRHRLALAGAAILALFYSVAAICEFVSPHEPNQRNAQYVLCPPQEIRFFDSKSNFHLHPFVYGLRQDPSANEWERDYLLATDKIYPIYFFADGPAYRMWNLFDAQVHLFSAGAGPMYLFGTDDLGRDVFSRILYGARISLTIGLIGVALTFLSAFCSAV